MVAAAFWTSTGLSGGTMSFIPLLALVSEHDRTQGTAREAEAIAMEAWSVTTVQTHGADISLHSSELLF